MPELPSKNKIIEELVSILRDAEKNKTEKYELCLELLKEHTKPGFTLDPLDRTNDNVWNIPGAYFLRIDYELAKSFYKEMLDWFLFRQMQDERRYHKGTPYHNLGIALFELGKFFEARRNVMLAFIEDVLTFPDPTKLPAYTVLRQIFMVNKDYLSELDGFTKKSIEIDRLDPSDIYQEFMNLESKQSLQTYEQMIFEPNKARLKKLLDSVEQAKTEDEKKKSLESLSEELFGSIQDFTVLPSTRTATGELDRIIRNENSHPFLTRLGSHIPIECKNWSEKVGAPHIRIFLDKLDEHRCECGVMLTRNGITGEGIRDAVGLIVSKFQKSGIIVIVMTKSDIERIINCENLIQRMKERYEDVKFGRTSKIGK